MITERLLTFNPMDSVTFRDGRPFEQDDQGLAETAAVFPPHPPTLAGAARVAMAVGIGIGSGLDWSELSRTMKGSANPEDQKRGHALAAILTCRITGPAIVRMPPSGVPGPRDVFFPCPFPFLFDDNTGLRWETPGEPQTRPLGCLVPATPGRTMAEWSAEWTSLRPFRSWRLPGRAASRAVPGDGIWITAGELNRRLADPTITPEGDGYRRGSAIAARETRIGIAIEKSTGHARDSQLFAAAHQQLREDGSRGSYHFAVFVEDNGALPDVEGSLVPFGGDGRFAQVNLGRELISWEQPPVNAQHCGGLLLVALTPVPVTTDAPQGLALPTTPAFADLTCIGYAGRRPVAMGYADGRVMQAGQTRVVTAFPAGAAWFLTLPPGDKLEDRIAELREAAKTQRLVPAGPDGCHLANVGFGAFIAGGWPK